MNNHHPNQPSLSARDVAIAGHSGDLATVLAGLNQQASDVRVAAVSALIRIGKVDVAQMQLLLRDPDLAVQRAAATVAHRTDVAQELVPDLVEGLTGEKTVVEACAFALGEIGATSPIVINNLVAVARSHEDALCREAAVAALGSLGTGLETILNALNDVATVRRRAVIALSPFEGPEVEAALRTATQDRDWQVRQAAEDLVDLGDELGL